MGRPRVKAHIDPLEEVVSSRPPAQACLGGCGWARRVCWDADSEAWLLSVTRVYKMVMNSQGNFDNNEPSLSFHGRSFFKKCSYVELYGKWCWVLGSEESGLCDCLGGASSVWTAGFFMVLDCPEQGKVPSIPGATR